jgi:PAS domain S-box-containing protein
MAIALRNARVMQSLRDQTQQVTVARFEAERRLKSLQKYADFFESSADGIVVMDADARLLFTNPKARSITGYEESDLHGRSFRDVFLSEMGASAARELFAAFHKGTYPQGVDMRIRTKDGRLRVASVNFTSVAREDGVVLCSFRDVTQERAVGAELVKTKDSLQRVIDASSDAIVSADMRGRVVLFNRAAERLYGRMASDVLGSDVRALYNDGTAVRIMRLIREGGGRIDGLQTEILDANRSPIPVSFSGALVHEGDTPVASVGIFTDLREKMRMERRLQQAQEQLLAQERQAIIAELAGAAAHELNQPLQSVMAYAQLLQRKLADTGPSSRPPASQPPASQPGASQGTGQGTGATGSSVLVAAQVIYSEAERMAEIVRKIGRITKYETKSYVGTQKILDLDKASEASQERSGPEGAGSSRPPPKSDAASRGS